MKNKMLTLQQLADITWKSVRTLRRVVKDSANIQTDYKHTKLVANLEDVLKHYDMTNQNDHLNSVWNNGSKNAYPKSHQSTSHDSQQTESDL